MSTAAAGTKNTERLMQVLLAPVVSEKSTFIGEKNNQYEDHCARTHIKAKPAVSKNGLLMSEQKPYKLVHF